MVVITHKSTGLKASIDGRNQHHNKRQARIVVENRVLQHFNKIDQAEESVLKKTLAGTGERADKIRTYRYQDGIVTDHRSGKKCQLKSLERGDFSKIL